MKKIDELKLDVDKNTVDFDVLPFEKRKRIISEIASISKRLLDKIAQTGNISGHN